jgi:hypothetical protein
VKPKTILPPNYENFTDNLEFPAETTKFLEVTDEVLLDLEQPVLHDWRVCDDVCWTTLPEMAAVTRSRSSIVKGNHNIIEEKHFFK